ncbi:MAG: hypothetical protein EPO31_06860 [Gammaproteobacteria bacterium]|nr:MAG: hypothetical protein EPO31_06860 [Gammaproteobacteria bacterium]
MELHRIGVKWFADERAPLNLLDLIPVFHRWIQDHVLDNLLIDVAEYTHMHHGPGVLIIAHEGNYGYDETHGERGLAYYSKQPMPETDLAARLATVARKGLEACICFTREANLGAQVSFPCNRLEVFTNDRLLAPNTDAAWEAFAPAVRALAARLFPGQVYKIERRSDDPRERLAAIIHAEQAPGPEALLARLT